MERGEENWVVQGSFNKVHPVYGGSTTTQDGGKINNQNTKKGRSWGERRQKKGRGKKETEGKYA